VKWKYDPTNLFRFEQSIGGGGHTAQSTPSGVEELVPEIAKSLGKPIVYPQGMGDES
jgi:hypothetical protein